MKKILFITFVTIQIIVSAQTEKGGIYLGGASSLDFAVETATNLTDDESETSLDFDFNPEIGFFVKKNFALGFRLPVSYFNSLNTYDYQSYGTTMGIAPFMKIYFGDKKVKPFLRESIGLRTGKYTYIAPNGASSKSSSLFLSNDLSFGVAFFLTEFAELNLALNHYFQFTNNIDSNQWLVNDFSIVGGLAIHFNKK